MWRILLVGFVCSFTLAALADEPRDLAKKPPYERLLKGEDAKRAEELTKQIAEREKADDYAGAIKLTEELLALRVRLQGEDHYEAIDRKHELAALRKVAALEATKRESWRAAMNGKHEATQLEAQTRYAQALAIRNRMLDLGCEVLGDEHSFTAVSYNNVAANLNAQGKAAEAEPLYRKALDIWRRVLGGGTEAHRPRGRPEVARQGKAVRRPALLGRVHPDRRPELGQTL